MEKGRRERRTNSIGRWAGEDKGGSGREDFLCSFFSEAEREEAGWGRLRDDGLSMASSR